MQQRFSVETTADQGQCVVWVAGDVDGESASRLTQAGVRAVDFPRTTRVIIDLSDVSFMDSAGIGSLVIIRKAAARAGKRFDVRNPSDLVRRVIEMTGLADYLLAPSSDGSSPGMQDAAG